MESIVVAGRALDLNNEEGGMISKFEKLLVSPPFQEGLTCLRLARGGGSAETRQAVRSLDHANIQMSLLSACEGHVGYLVSIY